MTIYSLDILLSYLEPVYCSMSSSNCCFLTCIQVSQEAGQAVWYSHLFQNFPQFIVIHTVKGFGIVNKAEIDGFLEVSCFFDDSADVGNLISGSCAFSKSSLNIWKFMVHVLLKPGLENFEHYFASVWDDQPRQHIKKQRHYFANKGLSSQSYGFSSSHVWTWELDYKESWVLKNWCFWTVVLEKTLESLLGCKEIQPVHPKGDQSWIFIGRIDAEAEAPLLWPHDVKNWLIGKTLMLGGIEGRKRRGRERMRWLDGISDWWMWICTSSRSWWWTGKPGLLQSMGWQRVGEDWVNELTFTVYQIHACLQIIEILMSTLKCVKNKNHVLRK